MRTVAPRVHDTLRDALVVEMKDLLAKMEVFEQGRTTGTDAQRVLVIGYQDTLLGRESGFFIRRGLVQLSALTPFLRIRSLPLLVRLNSDVVLTEPFLAERFAATAFLAIGCLGF